MKNTYYYVVDLDERGIYKSHVEHSETGKVIFELSNEDEDGNDEPLWIIEDGFMKNIQDMDGLHDCLCGNDILNPEDEIIYKG